jgi:hypothetical protein
MLHFCGWEVITLSVFHVHNISVGTTAILYKAETPVGMSCVCRDNHLLRCCIDIYCSSTLYTSELDELQLSDNNTILPRVIIKHTIHHHYSTNTDTHTLSEYFSQSHIATDGQSVCLSWCQAPSGAHDQILITV